jgi:hypothetical protein
MQGTLMSVAGLLKAGIVLANAPAGAHPNRLPRSPYGAFHVISAD